MQIAWIQKERYNAVQHFDLILKSYSFKSLCDELIRDNDNQLLTLLFDPVPNKEKQYKVKQEFSKGRGWCNSLKHRGILRFDGEKIQDAPITQIKFTDEYKAETGERDFCSEDFEPIYLDLDKVVIPELIAYHKNIIKLAKNVLELTGIYAT